jgi:hypothetical protein
MTKEYLSTEKCARDTLFLASVVNFLQHSRDVSGFTTAYILGLVSREETASAIENHPHNYELVTKDIGETLDFSDRLIGKDFFTDAMLLKFLHLAESDLHEYYAANPERRPA